MFSIGPKGSDSDVGRRQENHLCIQASVVEIDHIERRQVSGCHGNEAMLIGRLPCDRESKSQKVEKVEIFERIPRSEKQAVKMVAFHLLGSGAKPNSA